MPSVKRFLKKVSGRRSPRSPSNTPLVITSCIIYHHPKRARALSDVEKLRTPWWGCYNFLKKIGLKLVEYCKTHKSYISDSKLTKKKGKKIDAKEKQFQKF